MMELVDVADSKSAASDGVPVRLRLPAPRRSKLRTAQKRQSLLAAAVSSTVLRCSSSSPREPLCRARAGSPFSRADSWHFFAQFFQTRQVRTQGQSVKASGLSGFYPIAHASKVRGGLPGFHSALSSKCKHAKNDISCATFHALQLFSG